VLIASLAVGAVLALGMRFAGGAWHQGHLRVLVTVVAAAVAAGALGWGALRLARVEELAVLEDALRSAGRRRR